MLQHLATRLEALVVTRNPHHMHQGPSTLYHSRLPFLDSRASHPHHAPPGYNNDHAMGSSQTLRTEQPPGLTPTKQTHVKPTETSTRVTFRFENGRDLRSSSIEPTLFRARITDHMQRVSDQVLPSLTKDCTQKWNSRIRATHMLEELSCACGICDRFSAPFSQGSGKLSFHLFPLLLVENLFSCTTLEPSTSDEHLHPSPYGPRHRLVDRLRKQQRVPWDVSLISFSETRDPPVSVYSFSSSFSLSYSDTFYTVDGVDQCCPIWPEQPAGVTCKSSIVEGYTSVTCSFPDNGDKAYAYIVPQSSRSQGTSVPPSPLPSSPSLTSTIVVETALYAEIRGAPGDSTRYFKGGRGASLNGTFTAEAGSTLSVYVGAGGGGTSASQSTTGKGTLWGAGGVSCWSL